MRTLNLLLGGRKQKKAGMKNKSRYFRLHEEGDEPSRGRPRSIRLGSSSSSSRGFGRRVRIKKAKVKRVVMLLLSPVRLLKRLRDAYVSMMLSLAEKGDFSGAVMGNVYLPRGAPCRRLSGIDSRKEDEILAYIDFLRRTGRLVVPAHDPVLER